MRAQAGRKEPGQDGLADLRRALLVEGGARAVRGQALPLRTVQDWVSYAGYAGKSLEDVQVGAAGVTVEQVIGPAGVPGDPPAAAVGVPLKMGAKAREEWERRIRQELGEVVRLEFPAKVSGTVTVTATAGGGAKTLSTDPLTSASPEPVG